MTIGIEIAALNLSAALRDALVLGLGRDAGAGALDYAALMTGMVVFVNLALRPLVAKLNRQPIATTELRQDYAVEIVCRGSQEAHVRALMLQGFAEGGLHLMGLESEIIEDSDRVQVTAEVNAEETSNAAMEAIVGRLSLEPAVTAARWMRRESGM